MNGEKVLKLSTVADRLDLSVRTVRKYVREGAIPAHRIGPNQLLRVRESDLKEFGKESKNSERE